jgi:hypothetical protein
MVADGVAESHCFSGLEVDYDFYLQNHQGMFVVRSQEQYKLLSKLKKKTDFKNLLINQP